MINEGTKIHGAMTAVIHRADGTHDVIHKDNAILNVGFDFIADAIGRSSGRPGVMNHIAIGSGTTAVEVTQAALVNELGRQGATYNHAPGTKTFSLEAEFPAGVATGALTEAGVVNAPSSGAFLDRVTFPVVNKGSDDRMTVTFVFTLS